MSARFGFFFCFESLFDANDVKRVRIWGAKMYVWVRLKTFFVKAQGKWKWVLIETRTNNRNSRFMEVFGWCPLKRDSLAIKTLLGWWEIELKLLFHEISKRLDVKKRVRMRIEQTTCYVILLKFESSLQTHTHTDVCIQRKINWNWKLWVWFFSWFIFLARILSFFDYNRAKSGELCVVTSSGSKFRAIQQHHSNPSVWGSGWVYQLSVKHVNRKFFSYR